MKKVNSRAEMGVRAAEVQHTLEEKKDLRQEQNNKEVRREENSWMFDCGS